MANKWSKLKAEYIKGGISIKKLAQKYGVSNSSLAKVAYKQHWTQLRDKKDVLVGERIAKKTASIEADRNVERAERLYQASEDLLTRIVELIGAGDVPLTSQDASFLSSSLERLRRTMDVKSQKDLEEQDARIAKLRREATIEERSSEIRVVLSDDLTEYSE